MIQGIHILNPVFTMQIILIPGIIFRNLYILINMMEENALVKVKHSHSQTNN